MITVHQHIPAFVDGVPRKVERVALTDDLQSIPWIAEWRNVEGFERFESLEANPGFVRAVCGDEHWVVATYHEGDCAKVLQKWEVEIPPSCPHLAAFIAFYANSPVILASPGAFPVVAQCATCNGPLEVIDSGAVK